MAGYFTAPFPGTRNLSGSPACRAGARIEVDTILVLGDA